MIEAVIFDWAGTTVDYGCFAPVHAFIHAFEKYGVTPTQAEVRGPMGMLKRDHIKAMLEMPRIRKEWIDRYGYPAMEKEVNQVYESSEKGILDILHEFCDIKPYVLEVVDSLRSQEIRIGSTTGYTDEMMAIVAVKAKENGYEPDEWVSPNSVGNIGRPYPYMIFENMKQMRISSVHNVIKVGDTISDIVEGRAAGVWSVGVIEGSSMMALSRQEYEELSPEKRDVLCGEVRKKYHDAGADAVIHHLGELPELIRKIENGCL